MPYIYSENDQRPQIVYGIEAFAVDASEMPQMLKALNLDPYEVQAADPARFVGMQANCCGCGAKDRCRDDLATGTAARHFDQYCSNSDLINRLRADPDLLIG